MTTGTRSVGDFCWINILSPEPAKARDFFGKLLGWTFGEIPGMGYSLKVGGKDIGGLFDVQSPDGNVHSPLIGVMVKVESADAMGARAATLGGKSRPAFDVGPQGRMSVIHDPAGANIDVWQPKGSAGTDADAALPGAPSWFECMTTDMDVAITFYSGLFGWKAVEEKMPGFRYVTFQHAERPIAGLMAITPEMGDATPAWSTYFTVKNVDEAAKQAVALGGTIAVPAQDVSDICRACGIRSPQGVMFNVITYAQ